MIKAIEVGDITSPCNKKHIILGMNNTLEDLVNRIGRPYVEKLRANLTHPLDLGSVLSFRFDQKRDLYMLVCHQIGIGGWSNASKYVRFGMDYIDHTDNKGDHEFSIVQIGTGPIGRRDGADYPSIHTAIADSHLPVTLFIRDTVDTPVTIQLPKKLVAYGIWHPEYGLQNLG